MGIIKRIALNESRLWKCNLKPLNHIKQVYFNKKVQMDQVYLQLILVSVGENII